MVYSRTISRSFKNTRKKSDFADLSVRIDSTNNILKTLKQEVKVKLGRFWISEAGIMNLVQASQMSPGQMELQTFTEWGTRAKLI